MRLMMVLGLVLVAALVVGAVTGCAEKIAYTSDNRQTPPPQNPQPVQENGSQDSGLGVFSNDTSVTPPAIPT